MTILLDVIAVCRAPDDEVPPAPPVAEPEVPAVLPTASGVYIIHVAPSGRLDPSAKDLANVEIVENEDELDAEPAHLKKFLV